MADPEAEKRAAAIEAIKYVRDGMLIGIGTGSTVHYFIEELGRLVSKGLRITGVPTSKRTESEALKWSIPISTSPEREIDITFDGADEADPYGNLIKGGGGALLREKIIAYNSRKMFVLVDSNKMKPAGELGNFPLPVEVIPFLEERTRKNVEALGADCSFRAEKEFTTDNGNLILDCRFKSIRDPEMLEEKLLRIPGVVEAGLFCGYANKIFEGSSGGCKIHEIRE